MLMKKIIMLITIVITNSIVAVPTEEVITKNKIISAIKDAITQNQTRSNDTIKTVDSNKLEASLFGIKLDIKQKIETPQEKQELLNLIAKVESMLFAFQNTEFDEASFLNNNHILNFEKIDTYYSNTKSNTNLGTFGQTLLNFIDGAKDILNSKFDTLNANLYNTDSLIGLAETPFNYYSSGIFTKSNYVKTLEYSRLANELSNIKTYSQANRLQDQLQALKKQMGPLWDNWTGTDLEDKIKQEKTALQIREAQNPSLTHRVLTTIQNFLHSNQNPVEISSEELLKSIKALQSDLQMLSAQLG